MAHLAGIGKKPEKPITRKEMFLDKIELGGGSSGGASALDSLIDGSIAEVTSNAETVTAYALYKCKSLVTANFPLATSIGDYALSNCENLSTVNFPKVITIGESSFRSDKTLKSVTFPKATSMSQYAFANCDNLTTVDFPKLTKAGNSDFTQDKALTFVNLPNLQRTYKTFSDCTSLTTITLPQVTNLGISTFMQCYSLICVDLPIVTTIDAQAFQNDRVLKKVILRSENLCSLTNTNAFTSCYHITGETKPTYNPNGDKDGYIYVPRALVDTYKSATNWSTYATQFRALEDYTVDGTINGELDESKI